jgi:twitching motility protein PilU
MDNSIAEGSQSFEADLARLIGEGVIDRKEGLAYADSPTNLMWRLQNDFSKKSQAQEEAEHSDEPSFTDITLDVHPSGFRHSRFPDSRAGFEDSRLRFSNSRFNQSGVGGVGDSRIGDLTNH